MRQLLEVLRKEKKKIDGLLEIATQASDATARADYEKRLAVIDSDISRIEMYHDRPTMQTSSELLFIDDIRLRVKKILENSED